MQFLDCKITLSFSNQKIKDRSETLINKGIYEVKLKFIASLILHELSSDGFTDSDESDFWDDFDNMQKAKIVR